MGAAPPANPTLGTRDHPPTRHIITVTPRIAEASLFTLHPRITAIGTADPDTGITAGIIISEVTLTRTGVVVVAPRAAMLLRAGKCPL